LYNDVLGGGGEKKLGGENREIFIKGVGGGGGLRNLGGDTSSRPPVAQCPALTRGREELKLKMFENQIASSESGTTIKKSLLFFFRFRNFVY